MNNLDKQWAARSVRKVIRIIIKYFMILLLVCLAFAIFSICLDLLFWRLENRVTRAGIARGYSEYFPLFLGYYGWIIVALIIIFNAMLWAFPVLKRPLFQYILVLLIGLLVGVIIRENNLSVYKGMHEELKSILLYPLISIVFVSLKLLVK